MPGDRVALVTNVNHFVGLAAARALPAEGARTVCHDAAFADAGARERFAADNPGLDAAGQQDPAPLVAAVVAAHGRIDALVANDAFPAIRAPVEAARLDDLRAGLEALVVQLFAFAAAAAPVMRRRRSRQHRVRHLRHPPPGPAELHHVRCGPRRGERTRRLARPRAGPAQRPGRRRGAELRREPELLPA